MYSDTLAELGIAKNESYIYVALVKGGGMGISRIADKSGVHRRNVYDSMRRLLERGLVYEEVGDAENVYFAVDPQKLLEIVEEKRRKVEDILPDLSLAFNKTASAESVSISRGFEGWKNYLREMTRIKKPVRIMGAVGASLDPRMAAHFTQIKASLERNTIPVNVLYLDSAYRANKEIVGHFGKTSSSRILPKDMDLPESWAVFGDMMYLFSGGYRTAAVEKEIMITVIKNAVNAEGFRKVFDHLWEIARVPK